MVLKLSLLKDLQNLNMSLVSLVSHYIFILKTYVKNTKKQSRKLTTKIFDLQSYLPQVLKVGSLNLSQSD